MAGFAICGFRTAVWPQLVMLGLQLRVASGSRCSTPTIWWEPEKLEAQRAATRATPSAAWCLTGCEIVDGSDRTRPGPQSFAGAFPVFREIGYTPEGVFRQQLQQVELTAAGARHLCFHGDLFGLLFFGNVALPSSALIRRQFLEQIGAFDGFAADGRGDRILSSGRSVFTRRHCDVAPRPISSGAGGLDHGWAQRRGADRSRTPESRSASTRRPLRAADRKALSRGAPPSAASARLRALEREGRCVDASGATASAALRVTARPSWRGVWVASLLPPAALDGMHRGKRFLRRSAGQP